MDIRVFWDETPSYHYRGTYQCYSSGNGAYRSDVGIWRKAESLPMDWGDAGYCFFFHVKHNKWIFFIVLAAITGAISGLYDKYLMKSLNPMLVQSWYNVYQVFIMCPILLLLWWPKRKSTTPFRWDWTIILISVFLSAADFVYFYALSYDDSMISIVSMIRRGSVIVSFTFGALFFREKNLKSKAIDLILVLIGMIFLYLGSKN